MQLWRNAKYGCAKGVVLFASTVSLAAQLADATYHLEPTEPLSGFSPKQRHLLQKLNRADATHLSRWKRLIVPNRWELEELAYSPLPQQSAEPCRTLLGADVAPAASCAPPSRQCPVCGGPVAVVEMILPREFSRRRLSRRRELNSS